MIQQFQIVCVIGEFRNKLLVRQTLTRHIEPGPSDKG